MKKFLRNSMIFVGLFMSLISNVAFADVTKIRCEIFQADSQGKMISLLASSEKLTNLGGSLSVLSKDELIEIEVITYSNEYHADFLERNSHRELFHGEADASDGRRFLVRMAYNDGFLVISCGGID